MDPLITTSLSKPNTYFLFRPIGNSDYKEVGFLLTNGKLIEDHTHKLTIQEKLYIKEKILVTNV
tara:strand:- start:2709 stop:2900 length:192 start_codon:yes stop_codon:yes gene_type:complete